MALLIPRPEATTRPNSQSCLAWIGVFWLFQLRSFYASISAITISIQARRLSIRLCSMRC